MSGTALITGASQGIGRGISEQLAQRGYDLIIVARRESLLQEIAVDLKAKYGIAVTVYPCDLSAKDSAVMLYKKIKEADLQVDILVNNAGFGNYGRFIETDAQTDINLIDLNISALTYLTKLVLPEMIERKSGRVLNVGSIAGFVPGPCMNTYFASKAYVTSFSFALAEELKGTGVTVSCLAPGPTPTGFGERAHYDRDINRVARTSVDQVARVACNGMLKGKLLIVPGWFNKLIVFAQRFIPYKTMSRLVRKSSGY